MATYYWVGGTGNWDGSNTTRWATSSGGAGFAGVPGIGDDVIFDGNSASGANFTVSVLSGAQCNNLTISRPTTYTVTLNGAATVYGPTVSIGAAGSTGITTSGLALICPYNGVGTFLCTPTMSSLTFSGVASSWTLGANLAMSFGTLTVASSFSTSASNYSVSCGTFDLSNSNVRTISLNGSSISCSNQFNAETSTNLTMNAGTSTIVTNFFKGGSKTYYNLSNSTIVSLAVYGANTFSSISASGENRFGYDWLSTVFFADNQTIGTLSLNVGSAWPLARQSVKSTTGTAITLTVTTFSAASNVDFYMITIAGPAAPISGTLFGNCGGNTGITFPAAKTVYWNQAAGGNWGESSWALTPGGAISSNNFPLAQDTAVFATTGLNYNGLVTINRAWNIGTIDMSARTPSYQMRLFISAVSPNIFGNWIGGSGLVYGTTLNPVFCGVSNTTITSNGNTFCFGFDVQKLSGARLTLQDNIVTSTFDNKFVTLSSGILDLNGRTLYIDSISSSSTFLLARSLEIGSGTIIFRGGNGELSSPSGALVPTITATTGKISILTSATFTISDGFTIPCIVSKDSAGTLQFNNNNTLNTLVNTVAGGSITFTAGTTTTFLNDFAITKTCAISCVTASTYTLSKAVGTVVVANCTISGSNATGGATWLAPTSAGNVDGGTNTGWSFIAGTVYSDAVTEAQTTVDSISGGLTFSTAVIENNNATEVNAASLAFPVSITENQTVVDSDSVTDYWTVISTTQSPNWTPVISI
jgi:hypothetical protein